MHTLQSYINKKDKAAPLAVFRILFGLLMLASLIRFWGYGWINKLYVQPKLFFSYYGFEWVKPLGNYTYIVFIICALATIGIMLGYKYRLAIIVFFISFTYIELMDKTTYLNHYYFISILSFLMIFLPANAYFSIDAYKNARVRYQYIPKWTIDSLKLILGIVYFYAGLAKLNSDWLIKAMPLKIWLPSKFDIPFLGHYFNEAWVHYAFSWGGALYDLSIPFLLLYKKTRGLAFVAVVGFHVFTKVLFPIGMFPYIMIVCTLIFFESSFHEKILTYVSKIFNINSNRFTTRKQYVNPSFITVRYSIIILFFVFQIIIPFRYLLYPGELFWTEEGYRFSWRVMLTEKAGYAQFKIVDTKTGKWFYVNNSDFLTTFQEKQMATQADFILQYAKFLEQHFYQNGHKNIAIYVDNYVTLNGRLSSTFVNPNTDLTKQHESFKHKNWITPFTDEIKGI